MSNIARRLVLPGPAGTILATIAALATTAALAAPAALAVGSVTITTKFQNPTISLDTADAVGYALTNTTGAAQTVTFTDTLPAGVTLDNPIGTTNTNGTGTCTLTPPTANPGDGAVTLTVLVPSETATGSVCTIAFSVVAGAPSADLPVSDTYSNVSAASSATVTPKPGALTVLSNPTLTLTAPAANQSFSLGQSATAAFACTTTDGLDAIDSFFGTDDEGNQIQAGAPIDTVDPGTRSLQVDCYSANGGGDVSQTVSYTVGSYTLTAVRTAKATGTVSFRTLVPAGRLVAAILDGKTVIGTSRVTVGSRRRASVAVKLTATGRRLLVAAKGPGLRVKLQVSFTPAPIGTGDQQITPAAATIVSRTVRLPAAHG